MENKTKDFFISYTKKDEEWAKWMGAVLENNGFSCFCQYKDIKAGQNFLLEMDKAIKNCERIISILSPAYMQSFYADEEWTAFLAQKRYANIIPVRIEDFQPDGLWAARVYIDLAGKNVEEAEKNLLAGVSSEGHPQTVISFPGTPRIKFPGEMPLNNLTDRRNPHFTGRQEVLEKIHQTFEKGNDIALTQAIAGLGGIGKTQVALEYAYRYGYEYNCVWWVNAETKDAIFASYQKFALNKNLINDDTKEAEIIIEAVRYWLQQNDNWLFIFDNAEDEKSLQSFLPSQIYKKQHIMITTRNTRFMRCSSINIGIFTEDEACNFIEKYTKKPADKHFKELAKMMGYLPLALDMAGAYMAVDQVEECYREYLEMYKDQSLVLLKEYLDEPDKKTVTSTWRISIDKINNQASKQLLNLCAYFAPDNINKTWFVSASSVLPDELQEEVVDKHKYKLAISELTKYSLISLDDNGLISIHRLVQEVIRESLIHEQTKWRNICINILNKLRYFDFSTSESRALFLTLAAHIENLTKDITNEAATEEVANLYGFLGSGFNDLADYKKALDYYEKTIAIRERVLGAEHPDTATTNNNIANVYQLQGVYDKALEYYGKAIAIREKVQGTEHPDIATNYNNMTLVYDNLGDYNKALEYYNGFYFCMPQIISNIPK